MQMMGKRGSAQDKLFYSFNLDNHVPQNHLLRGIDAVLDLGDLRRHLAPFYSHTGRPDLPPSDVPMIRKEPGVEDYVISLVACID